MFEREIVTNGYGPILTLASTKSRHSVAPYCIAYCHTLLHSGIRLLAESEHVSRDREIEREIESKRERHRERQRDRERERERKRWNPARWPSPAPFHGFLTFTPVETAKPHAILAGGLSVSSHQTGESPIPPRRKSHRVSDPCRPKPRLQSLGKKPLTTSDCDRNPPS